MQITNGVHVSLRSACFYLSVLLLAAPCALGRPSSATARCRCRRRRRRRRRRRAAAGRVRSFRPAAQRGEAGMTCQPAALDTTENERNSTEHGWVFYVDLLPTQVLWNLSPKEYYTGPAKVFCDTFCFVCVCGGGGGRGRPSCFLWCAACLHVSRSFFARNAKKMPQNTFNGSGLIHF